ncbi:MAG: SLC13 family permease [Alphaproteobacteria bacterium]|nr:SLC13 family permease [Alphaproteobacteria bacterium]
MTPPQMMLFALFGGVLLLLLWGRLRHDLVAAGGLFAGVLAGLVPESKVFSGFSNPAVLVVALVLIASRAFENSGALGLVMSRLGANERPLPVHVALTGTVAAGLSAVINNVAALALLMPLDMQAARKAGRSPSLTLMPLAFATILGGMVTMIGTPPNIIAASIRERELGASYRMLDFAPVGLVVAAAGLAFVALVGWRLIPARLRDARPVSREEEFVADLVVPAESAAIGKMFAELEPQAESADVVLTELMRDGEGLPGGGRFHRIAAGDVLVVEGATDAIAGFIQALGLQPEHNEEPAGTTPAQPEAPEKAKGHHDAERLAIMEVVVRSDARIAGRSAKSIRLRSRFGVTLLGISRRGRLFREQVQTRVIEAGDMLLIGGSRRAVIDAANWLGVLPINEASVTPARTWKIALAIGLFVAAIAVASTGWLSFATTLGMAVAGYAAAGLVAPREFYDQIEWPVVVMLACLLPLGAAFDEVGGTALAADFILDLTRGGSPVVALIVMMIVIMTLSDVLNNVATMVIAGPLAIAMARKLGVNPDTFLMAAAVATSCAFLTPIGHKNNTLIMGPGGYAFGDYWRLGLPLEIIVLVVGVPMLLIVWPL